MTDTSCIAFQLWPTIASDDVRWSRSQIDRLGQELGRAIEEQSIRDLDRYRRTFWPAYLSVGADINRTLPRAEPNPGTTEVSSRFGKSVYATVAKLRRQTVRLSQVQDIAGYRIIARTALDEKTILRDLLAFFDPTAVYNRLESPNHGYRAIHLVVRRLDRAVEIQLRTVFQHLWAQMSEKLSDTLEYPGIKYGEYPPDFPEVGEILDNASMEIAHFESIELAEGPRVPYLRNRLLERLRKAFTILEDRE